MSDDKFTAQRFIYAGRRIAGKSLVHTWLPEGAEPTHENLRIYSKAKGTVPGAVYTIKVNDDGSSYVPKSVEYVEPPPARDVALEFDADDHAAAIRHRRGQLERKEQSELQALCAPLRELVSKQVGWQNRSALLAYINSEISR